MSQKLKNGATEIARISMNGRTHVMAKTTGFLEFVTWEVDDEGHCYLGHYFHTHNEAAQDLIERS